MPWPNSCPPDLRRFLEAVLGFRSHGPAELWGAFKDWAEVRGIEAPDARRKDPGLVSETILDWTPQEVFL